MSKRVREDDEEPVTSRVLRDALEFVIPRTPVLGLSDVHMPEAFCQLHSDSPRLLVLETIHR